MAKQADELPEESKTWADGRRWSPGLLAGRTSVIAWRKSRIAESFCSTDHLIDLIADPKDLDHVRYWPLADIAGWTAHVLFWGSLLAIKRTCFLVFLRCKCLLLTQSGHPLVCCTCPLSGVKRTSDSNYFLTRSGHPRLHVRGPFRRAGLNR